MTARRFELHRDVDETGISGTDVVAEGVVCTDGVAMMRWLTEWPSSVCFYERGIESVEAIHGHNGKTRIVILDDDELDDEPYMEQELDLDGRPLGPPGVVNPDA